MANTCRPIAIDSRDRGIVEVITPNRDYTIDALRGIAAISVIYIHTVFHSGEQFVPADIRNLALLIDVPLFMFLAGWSASYSKSPSRRLFGAMGVAIRWMLFISFVDLICCTLGIIEFKATDYLNQVCCRHFGIEELKSVGWSTWFIPMYIRVSILGCLIVHALSRSDDANLEPALILLTIAMVTYYSCVGASEPFPHLLQTTFYLFFYLLGHWVSSRPKSIGSRNFASAILLSIAIVALWWIAARLCGVSARNLQSSKFPPNIVYLIASLLSVEWAVVLHNSLPQEVAARLRFLRFVGRNALDFYFAQGIAASALFGLLPYTEGLPLPLRILAHFMINLTVTTALASILSWSYKRMRSLTSSAKELISSRTIRKTTA